MSKTKTLGTLRPEALAPGSTIHFQDLRGVAENLNFAAGESPVSYLNMVTGLAGWGSTANEPDTLGIVATDDFTEVLLGDLWIDEDEQGIVCGAELELGSGNTVEVTFSVGGDSDTISFTDADNGTEKTVTLTPSALGWEGFSVALERTAGSDPLRTLVSVRIEGAPIPAADLPDPD